MLPGLPGLAGSVALAARLGLSGSGLGCSALVLSPGLSHAVDEITVLHMMTQKAGSRQIFGQALPRGAGGSGAARQLPAQGMVSDRVPEEAEQLLTGGN